MKLDLESERYAATGNISGSGVERSLGTPTMNPLQILLRETVQNSWDARISEEGGVIYRVTLRTMSRHQSEELLDGFHHLPADAAAKRKIHESLRSQSTRVLCIEDFNTAGLSGPTRADIASSQKEEQDFVNFFRNIGSPRDRDFGGGTYGYGKSSTYSFSACRTILAYTATVHRQVFTQRLMAAAIGNPFESKGKKFTGRHWWGIQAADGTVDPLEGDGARKVAESLGIKQRGPKQRGTSLMIIDPLLDERTDADFAEEVVQSLLWHCWPKMLRVDGGVAPMQFELMVEDERIEFPDPARFPPLSIFTECLRAVRAGTSKEVRCERPAQKLGLLDLQAGPRLKRHRVLENSQFSHIPEICSHVALMRPAELVVKYIQGPPLSSDLMEYAGVFMCGRDVEPSFARAEPPAHDDWVPDHLEGRDRTFVRVALRRIKDFLISFSTPPAVTPELESSRSLALLGDSLGGLLVNQLGSGLSPAASKPSASKGKRQASSVQISDAVPFRFAMVRRKPCALFRFEIHAPKATQVLVRATPQVVVEGGVLPSPAGFAPPEVVAWLTTNGKEISAEEETPLQVGDQTAFLVAVSVAGDYAVRVQLSVGKSQ
jgi:hypothetical protein